MCIYSGLGWRSGCATSRSVPGSIPGGVTGFFSDIFLPTVPWSWGQLRPSENDYIEEYFLGVKTGGP